MLRGMLRFVHRRARLRHPRVSGMLRWYRHRPPTRRRGRRGHGGRNLRHSCFLRWHRCWGFRNMPGCWYSWVPGWWRHRCRWGICRWWGRRRRRGCRSCTSIRRCRRRGSGPKEMVHGVRCRIKAPIRLLQRCLQFLCSGSRSRHLILHRTETVRQVITEFIHLALVLQLRLRQSLRTGLLLGLEGLLRSLLHRRRTLVGCLLGRVRRLTWERE